MTKFIEYIGAAMASTMPLLLVIGQSANPLKEPRLMLSPRHDAMVWSYPGQEYQARNFMDIKPFGSLDEVVLRTRDGRMATLKPGDDGFSEQEQVYRTEVAPYFNESIEARL